MNGEKLDSTHVSTAPPFLTWAETLFLCLLFPALGWWLDPRDPLFTAAPFPWLVLAPLLPALRYGFTHGFVSALLLIGLIALGWQEGMLPANQFPSQLAVGLLIVGMLAGEFTDVYQRRIEQQKAINGYQRMRLDEFTRNYHLLKASHDRLEQRLASGTQSLRGALLDLKRRLTKIPQFGNDPLETLAQQIIGVFATFGWIQVAGLYRVRQMHLDSQPLATLGELRAVDPFDPLIRHTLTERRLVSLRETFVEKREESGTLLLAAVPLVDVNEKIWGVLVVQEMPFIALHKENLRLLAVMGGHIGDILSAGQGGEREVDAEGVQFRHHLARALEDLRKYAIPSLAVAIRFPPNHPDLDQLIELFLSQVRGLDRPWRPAETAPEQNILYLLMPLTTEHEFDPYRQRMERLLKENFGEEIESLGIRMYAHALVKKDNVQGILEKLHEFSNTGLRPVPRS